MSDTGTQTEDQALADQRRVQAAQELDLGDLFSRLSIDATARRTSAVGTPLGKSEARSLIETILAQGADTREARQVARTLAEQIVQSLPDDVPLTDTFLSSIDYRVYVQAAQNSGWAGPAEAGDRNQRELQRFRSSGLDAIMIARQEAAAKLVGGQADIAGVSESARQEATAKAQTVPESITLSPEAVLQVTAPDGPVMAPGTTSGGTTTDAAAAAQADTAFSAMFDPNDPLFTQQQAKPTFPEDDYRQLVDMGLQSFVDVINAEQQFNADTGQTGMQTSILYSPGGPDVPGSSQRSGRKLSLTSALDLPNTLGYDQVAELQQKLAMAGYFDQLGQGYREGDPDDDATRKAWENALADVYRAQKDEPQTGVVQFLARKAVTYRDEVAKRARDRFMPLDNDYVRASADAMATDLIGRRLNDQEYTKLRDQLVGLRNERANDVIGVDQMNWAADDTARTYGFSSDDINRRIMKDFAGESARQNAWDAMQKVNDFFGVEYKPNPRQEDMAGGT